MTTEKIEKYTEIIINTIVEYSPKVVTAIIILFAGLWLTSILTKTIKKVLIKREVDITLSNFIGNFIFWTLRVLVFITVISNLGVPTSSFVAILGAAGLAVGLALQGSLSNFAGGILIILFKPFKLGDLIEAQGEIGSVKEIQIFNTRLLTGNNQTVYIPNGSLSNGIIKNYTQEGIRRLDLTIGVDYNSDLKQVKDVILEVLDKNPLVLKEPAPVVLVMELADSSINLSVRPWTNAENFLTIHSETLEQCKIAFDAVGIEIPYPHQVEIKKK
ncbi:mechanosensitive ion channel [Flavobacterium jejuense]|uniref:Mechanosensitive ion channel n=1 Tax=Flavobacterium jejuense TaxID=1544455 RepID=A0ABX0IWC5_9FLAO|nr:mechanosensitive ion channel domain-containing protein [Flavobacterium jejuense]NHN27496.1 mechanosensitive ion channel [Flavobacterium jejuense]